MGAGTLSFAYVVMKLGYVLGPVLIILGAMVSYYSGMLIVKASEYTDRTRYEDIALYLYGTRVSRLISYLNLLCLIGFSMAYVTYVKKALPHMVERYSSDPTLHEWLGDHLKGNIVSAAIFSFGIMFPMSIPRNASALRFSSLLGVVCSVYLCLAIFCVFFLDKKIVPDPIKNLEQIEPVKLSYNGILSSIPLIIFAYMYQMNVPMIYHELESRESIKMSKIIAYVSVIAVIFYIIVGVFGYATFAQQ